MKRESKQPQAVLRITHYARRITNCGFTLIELAATIFIVGLVLWISLAVFTDPVSTKLAAEARSALATAQSCRMNASVAGRDRTMVYDLDTQKYWVETPPDEEGSTSDPERVLETDLPGAVRLDAVLLDGKTHTDGQVRLTGLPSGFLPAHILRLRHLEGSLQVSAVIGPFPGQARVVDGTPAWEEAFVTETESDVVGGAEATQ